MTHWTRSQMRSSTSLKGVEVCQRPPKTRKGVYNMRVPRGDLMNVEFTSNECDSIMELILLALDGLYEDDERTEEYKRLYNKCLGM